MHKNPRIVYIVYPYLETLLDFIPRILNPIVQKLRHWLGRQRASKCPTLYIIHYTMTYSTFRLDRVGLPGQLLANHLVAPQTTPDHRIGQRENDQGNNVVDQQQSHVVTTSHDE